MIYYEVTKDDLMKYRSFTWQNVLQTSCSTNEWFAIKKEFLVLIRELTSKVRYRQIDMIEANIEIRKEVLRLTEKYPSAFPKYNELGAYSKRVLATKFLAGEITINNNYDVNKMLLERVDLLREIAEADSNRIERENKRIEEERLALEEAEASRIPVTVGMLFKTKAGIARAYIHQYPKDTKMSAIEKEITNAVTIERGKHTFGKLCWRVNEVLVDGGRAWTEDVVNTLDV